jgi:hypothetical protein
MILGTHAMSTWFLAKSDMIAAHHVPQGVIKLKKKEF